MTQEQYEQEVLQNVISRFKDDASEEEQIAIIQEYTEMQKNFWTEERMMDYVTNYVTAPVGANSPTCKKYKNRIEAQKYFRTP